MKVFPWTLVFWGGWWQAVGLFLHTPAPLCAVSIILLWQGTDTSNRPRPGENELFSGRCTARCKVQKCGWVFFFLKKMFILMNWTGWFLIFFIKLWSRFYASSSFTDTTPTSASSSRDKTFRVALFCISELQLWVKHIKNTSSLQAALEFNSKQPHICFPASTQRRPPTRSPLCANLQRKLVQSCHFLQGQNYAGSPTQ